MALISCPECGKEISDKAKACIHCGYPIATKAHLSAKSLQKTVTSEQPEPPTEQTTRKPMDTKITSRIVFGCIIVIVLIGIIIGVQHKVEDTKARQRDLSSAFDFSFNMNIADVIAYEEKTYNHTVYEYDEEFCRLDFAPYDDHGEIKYRHRYFFDKETGLLTDVYYMDVLGVLGNKSDANCNHIQSLTDKVFKIAGKWDEQSYEGLFKTIYGQIDGVACKVQYQDGSDAALFIYSEES